jgi:hypothetical protein
MGRIFTLRFFSILLVSILLTGCYSSRVSTNKTPNGQKVEKSFATGFFYGLATPGANFYADRCEHGVARVETKISFLNMVASNVSFGLYTPMHVEAYCAEPSSAQASIAPTDSIGTQTVKSTLTE